MKIEDFKEDTILAIQHRCKTNNDLGKWSTIHSFSDPTTQREAYVFFKENYKDIPNWEFRLIRADICVNITVLEKTNYENS